MVVKVLRADGRDDRRALRGLRAEAQMLQQIRHPVIVRGFGAVLDGPCPHIVLEHLEGPALSTLLRRHAPLPLRQLVPLVIQMGSALHHLHAERLVHLDVKPRNIIMGAPRLIDLSIARSFEAAARLKHPVGTTATWRQSRWIPRRTARSVRARMYWGLGATLYEAGAAPMARGRRRSPSTTARRSGTAAARCPARTVRDRLREPAAGRRGPTRARRRA